MFKGKKRPNSKKDIQYNGQKTNDKKTNNGRKHTTQKTNKFTYQHLTSLKAIGELKCSGRISHCSSTRRVTVKQHKIIYSAISLKQQSAGRHIAPLGHIILIPSQPVFAFTPCLVEKQQIPII